MTPQHGYQTPPQPGQLPKVPTGPAEGLPREIRDRMDRIRAEGLGPIHPPIFYGGNVQLAREIGVPVFINGDTGEVVRTSERDGGEA